MSLDEERAAQLAAIEEEIRNLTERRSMNTAR